MQVSWEPQAITSMRSAAHYTCQAAEDESHYMIALVPRGMALFEGPGRPPCPNTCNIFETPWQGPSNCKETVASRIPKKGQDRLACWRSCCKTWRTSQGGRSPLWCPDDSMPPLSCSTLKVRLCVRSSTLRAVMSMPDCGVSSRRSSRRALLLEPNWRRLAGK